MGCLFEIIKLTYKFIFFLVELSIYAIIISVYLIYILLKILIKLVMKLFEKSLETDINIPSPKNILERKNHIIPSQEIPKEVYLKVYINKKYRELKKDDELDIKKLGTYYCDVPSLDYDEYTKEPGFNVFKAIETTSEQFGTLFQRLQNYCGDEFYATISYEPNQIKYKITIKNNNIFINGMNVEYMKNRYNQLKNSIINYTYKLYEIDTYLKEEHYKEANPYNEIDIYYISDLSDKLKETNDILLFELPYMEEVNNVINHIEPLLDKIYQREKQLVMDSLPTIEVIEMLPEEASQKEKKKPKKKELSWEEQEFEEEADLWGLSEEDRRIAKEEGMSPADFVEAEEYDDDELLLDEWER